MAFSDYPTSPSLVTTIGGASMVEGATPRAGVNNALRQLASDGRALSDTVSDLAIDGPAIIAAAASAALSASNAANSALSVGFYAAALANVPRGVTAVNMTNAGTAGGADAIDVAVTWAGGNFTSNPTILFNRVGGVVTNVRLTGGGLYVGASPTAPTATFPGAGAGFAFNLTTDFLVQSGATYQTDHATDVSLGQMVRNNAGVAAPIVGATYTKSITLAGVVPCTVGGTGTNISLTPTLPITGGGLGQLLTFNAAAANTWNTSGGFINQTTVAVAGIFAGAQAKLVLTNGKDYPERIFTTSCGVILKPCVIAAVNCFVVHSPDYDRQDSVIFLKTVSHVGLMHTARLPYPSMRMPSNYEDILFMVQAGIDKPVGSPSLTIRNFEDTATLLSLAIYDKNNQSGALTAAKLFSANDFYGVKRFPSGQFNLASQIDMATTNVSTLAMSLGNPGVIQFDKRSIGLYRANADTFQINLSPPKTHYRGAVKWNRSDVTTFMIKPDLILGTEFLINSIVGRRDTREAQLCNFLFTDLISGIITANGLVPTTIEGVMSLGLAGATPVNGTNYQLAGPGHGHEVMVTPSVMTGTANDAATGNVDVVSNNLETMVVGKGFSGKKIVIATTVNLTIPNGQTCAQTTRTLTFEPASNYQMRIQSSHNFTIGAVTAAIAYGYAGMLGLSDCNRICGVVNGVAGSTVTIGNGDGATIPLGLAEKVVAWHSSNPNVRIEIECADGFGYSHRENGVLIARTDNVLVIDNDYGAKVYFAIDGASNDARSLSGIVMAFDFFYRVVGADSIV